MNLLSPGTIESMYIAHTGAKYRTDTRLSYSIRRRDGADANDYATVYAERERTGTAWQWSCFRCGGQLTAGIAIKMAQDHERENYNNEGELRQ